MSTKPDPQHDEDALLALVLELIREITGFDDVEAHTELLVSGILDSFGTVTLVEAVADKFSARLPPESHIPATFSTPAALARVLQQCRE